MTSQTHALLTQLVGAGRWLLDDMADAGESHNPETGDEYDSVTAFRQALEEAESHLRYKRLVGSRPKLDA